MSNDSEKVVPYPYGRTVDLPGKISEVDRAFFSLYKMDLSLHCISAEVGHYYECLLEAHFSMERFESAAQQFDYFRRNPHKCSLLKGGKKVLVKHIDLSKVKLHSSQLKHLISSVKQEFDFLSRVSGKEEKQKDASNYLADVFMILSPAARIFYLFLERPEETLDDLLRRTANSSFTGVPQDAAALQQPSKVWVKKSHHWRPNEQHIALEDAKKVMRKVGKAVLHLHQNGLIHGALDPRAVFIFRPHRGKVIEEVKLANFVCAARIRPSAPESESFRRQEITALQSMAVQVADNTAYTGTEQKEAFYFAITLLTFTTDEEGVASKTTFEALNSFLEALKF